eukprot:Skav205006  [mRNA]  locus=scaffold3521:197456:207343:- [translate_table: standard]
MHVRYCSDTASTMLALISSTLLAAVGATQFEVPWVKPRRNARVAVMDTYVGKAKAALLLVNASGWGKRRWSVMSQHSYRVMPFGTAFGVADGNYQAGQRICHGSCDSCGSDFCHDMP